MLKNERPTPHNAASNLSARLLPLQPFSMSSSSRGLGERQGRLTSPQPAETASEPGHDNGRRHTDDRQNDEELDEGESIGPSVHPYGTLRTHKTALVRGRPTPFFDAEPPLDATIRGRLISVKTLGAARLAKSVGTVP